MTICTATTAAGQSCKNHAVKGTQLCKAHGGKALSIVHGAPVDNSNALKHGFYRDAYSEEEYAHLIKYAEHVTLADDLALARVRLNRINTYINKHEKTLDHEEFTKLNSLVYTALRTIAILEDKLDGRQPDHWDIVLNQLSIDLGMDL